VEALTAIKGVRKAFPTPFFHECALILDRPVGAVLKALESRGILGGFDLTGHYPELGSALLVCATEARTHEDIDAYARAMNEALNAARAA
jgi:glycine dehydrogenase subunit 1